MKAVVSVIGKDKTGIIATESNFLFEHGVNIIDISQSVLGEYFAMIMMVDISASSTDLATLSDLAKTMGEKIGVTVTVQHEDIFNAMHKI
ncbi:MAG: ACT domain-containing protein [Clostridia bacterium]|nr:ACT domain-containing protein [Clostridia bacterium]